MSIHSGFSLGVDVMSETPMLKPVPATFPARYKAVRGFVSDVDHKRVESIRLTLPVLACAFAPHGMHPKKASAVAVSGDGGM